jgi:hypothetical protein
MHFRSPVRRHLPRFASAALAAACLVTSAAAPAAALVRSTSGANAAAIQATVDQFRADLGGVNNGVGGSFPTGRREINWDGVPDTAAAPANLAADFFNVNSPRGVVFQSPCSNATFRVSADSNNPSSAPVRFADIDASYSAQFTTFSAERLFTNIAGSAAPCNIVDVVFFIPGSNTPATVSGFGVVFTDVDLTANARIIAYGPDGRIIAPGFLAPAASASGLSFVGVTYTAGERIARVSITSGNDRLASGNVDGVGGLDIVAMDDFIYGEPRPLNGCVFQDSFECAASP